MRISKINFALADNLEHAKPLFQLRHHIPRRRHACADLWGFFFDDQLSFLEENIFKTFLVSLRLHWRQSWYVRIFLKSSPILLCSPHYVLWEQIWGGLRERHRRRGQSGWEEWWCWQKLLPKKFKPPEKSVLLTLVFVAHVDVTKLKARTWDWTWSQNRFQFWILQHLSLGPHCPEASLRG